MARANTARQKFALNIDECARAILKRGDKRTVLVQGDMGSGKSSILMMLAKALPTHIPIYFDATTKDLGDFMVPMFDKLDDEGVVRYAYNEELGLHLDKPVILMIDEFGKANPSVKLALLRLMLERKIGKKQLKKGSIIFATTNLGTEGVGDILPPHARNRISIVTMRKSDNMEWIEWGIENDVDHTLLGWCKENPSLFHSFAQYEDPKENPYIFHPQAPERTSFVTPRSLEAASDWLKVRHELNATTISAALIGTIGERGALDLQTHVAMADQLPTLDSIKNDPANAKVGKSAAAVCMTVYRTLGCIERNWMDAWMTYMDRLHKEAQGLFVNGVRAEQYSRRDYVVQNRKFQEWCLANNYIYTVDKKS